MPVGRIRHVETRALYKDYGRRRALAGVDLRLEAGQASVLLGENGAGKSTLLGILSTLVRPSRGAVLYDGRGADELDPAALRGELGVLAHEPRCYADLSARENLIFFARGYGLPAPRARAQAMVERLGLAAAADRPVRTFSRGMLQRLALGRTLLHQPGLLLLDEPYTGLDRDGAALLTALLREERQRGAIVLCTSHDLEAVAPLCDQALVLRGGRLVRRARFPAGGCSAAALLGLYQGRREEEAPA